LRQVAHPRPANRVDIVAARVSQRERDGDAIAARLGAHGVGRTIVEGAENELWAGVCEECGKRDDEHCGEEDPAITPRAPSGEQPQRPRAARCGGMLVNASDRDLDAHRASPWRSRSAGRIRRTSTAAIARASTTTATASRTRAATNG